MGGGGGGGVLEFLEMGGLFLKWGGVLIPLQTMALSLFIIIV